MKISEIITAGTVDWMERYNTTQTSTGDTMERTADVPEPLTTIATRHSTAEVVIYGDGTMGIDIDGRTWAVEQPHPDYRHGVKLPSSVWRYISLALERHERSARQPG